MPFSQQKGDKPSKEFDTTFQSDFRPTEAVEFISEVCSKPESGQIGRYLHTLLQLCGYTISQRSDFKSLENSDFPHILPGLSIIVISNI